MESSVSRQFQYCFMDSEISWNNGASSIILRSELRRINVANDKTLIIIIYHFC